MIDSITSNMPVLVSWILWLRFYTKEDTSSIFLYVNSSPGNIQKVLTPIKSDLNLQTMPLFHVYSSELLLHPCHIPKSTYGPPPLFHIHVHTQGAPVINCECSGFPANLLCVAFN